MFGEGSIGAVMKRVMRLKVVPDVQIKAVTSLHEEVKTMVTVDYE